MHTATGDDDRLLGLSEEPRDRLDLRGVRRGQAAAHQAARPAVGKQHPPVLQHHPGAERQWDPHAPGIQLGTVAPARAAPPLERRGVELSQIPAVRPSLVAVVRAAQAAPLAVRGHQLRGLAEHELRDLLGAHRGVGE